MKDYNKIATYLNKTITGKISKFSYKYNNIIKGDIISINYFYWWYKEVYKFKTVGICVRKKKKFNFNSISLTLFYIIKNVRVNQVYLNTSPFIIGLKKRNKRRKKLVKSLYIL